MKKFNQYLTIVQENREPINEGTLSKIGAIITLLTGLATSPIKANDEKIEQINMKVEKLSDDPVLIKSEKEEYIKAIDEIEKNLKLDKEDLQQLKTPVMGGHHYNFNKNKIKEIIEKLKKHLSTSR